MKPLSIAFAALLLSACSSHIVTMDGTTHQANDLRDLDQDGVIEARERCDETLKGASIDNYGCGQIKSINERRELNVLFANDSYYLDPQYYGQLEELAEFMRQYPNTRVTIEGHCSKVGSYAHNLALSQNRANAITALLTERYGINSDRLRAVGYSFDRPVDLTDTPDAHKRNRRVIAAVVGEDTTADMKWHIYTVDDLNRL
ncbi:MAG: OmpA family protein [Shewanella sp.]|nr:OmpA family protein [Shewanella sp.]MCF1431623.1 OmpA family protein [Shewanella sp.]MCF1437895.1 OmpA family protein [Shewanella sp.]MCF1457174.1 OmpA family protein [Shewanella sp.]